MAVRVDKQRTAEAPIVKCDCHMFYWETPKQFLVIHDRPCSSMSFNCHDLCTASLKGHNEEVGWCCLYMYYHVEGVVVLEYQTPVREREPMFECYFSHFEAWVIWFSSWRHSSLSALNRWVFGCRQHWRKYVRLHAVISIWLNASQDGFKSGCWNELGWSAKMPWAVQRTGWHTTV